MMRKTKGGYVLKSKDGTKTLGTFKTKEKAVKRERQIQFFKHLKKARKK